MLYNRTTNYSPALTLSKEEKNYILIYLDEYNGGTFNNDILAIVCPEIEAKLNNNEFDSSSDLLLWIYSKGIEAVEKGILSYNQLLGREKIN